ncbi:MAG TPA: ATP-binding protein, partial [bacterium]|nr:ATP-binding protein [bacterium]
MKWIIFLAVLLSLPVLTAFPLAQSSPVAGGNPPRTALRVGVYQLPPLVQFDGHGNPSGVVIDVVNSIAMAENWDIEYQPCAWADCMDRIKTGSLDMLCLIADLPERRQWIEFNTEPVYLDWGQIWTRPGSRIVNLNDLHGKRVAGIKEEVFTSGFKKILEETALQCQYMEVDGYRQLVEMLTENAVDAAILNRMFDPGFFDADLVKTNIVFSPTPMGFGFPVNNPNNPQLIMALDRHLRRIKNDSSSIYYQSMEKWMKEDDPGQHWAVTVLEIVGIVVILIGLIIIWRRQGRHLRRQATEIESKSRQLDDMSLRRFEAEENYSWLFNTISVGVMVTPMHADGSVGVFTEVNRQACLMFGRNEDQMKRMTLLDLIPRSDRPRIAGLIRELTVHRQTAFQIPVPRADAPPRIVEIQANLIDIQDQWKILSVVRDVSERMVMEQEYQEKLKVLESRFETRTREIQEMNRELQMFAGTISHDLQGPLRTIEETLERVKSKCINGAPEADLEINRASVLLHRVNQLLRGLLEYTRLTRKDIEMSPVGLSQICSEAVLQLDGMIHEHNARVTIERPMPRVKTHSYTLIRVIQNLLSNAIKFVEIGRQPRVILRSELREDMVRLWVIDNGIGIAPEYEERIFEAFQRLHGADEYPGNGLGLAIVKRAVERMNGRFGVISEVGEGSRFWIELPVADT